jgi:hypothetical protein
MMVKKKSEAEYIEVVRYDEEVGDQYLAKVPKISLDACQLCACAGCLSDKCCEHLEYWNSTNGKPARYQIDDLRNEIEQRNKIIKALEQRLQAIGQSCAVFLRRDHVGVLPEDKAFIEVLGAAAEKEVAHWERMVANDDYFCKACKCNLCCDRMMVRLKNNRSIGDFVKVPECCGHKVSSWADLPF